MLSTFLACSYVRYLEWSRGRTRTKPPPRGRLHESLLVGGLLVEDQNSSLLINCSSCFVAWVLLSLFPFSNLLPAAIQTMHTIEVVPKTYLGMAVWVPPEQKHTNVRLITLVCGRRISRYEHGWPVRCHNRIVIAHIWDEATAWSCRKEGRIPRPRGSSSETRRYDHSSP